MGVRVRRMIVASVVVAIAAVAPLGAVAAPLPDVNVPAPPVQLPAVPTPSTPPVPVPTVPAPQLPAAPAPAPVPVPSVPLAPSGGRGQDPARALGQVVGTTVERVADGSRGGVTAARTRAAEAGGTDGSRSDARARARSRRARAERVHNRRQRLVRQLRGCLDELSPVRGQLLVLRYGVGRGRPRAPAYVARKLGLGRQRYAVVHRRALRRLATLAETTGCRQSGVAPSLFVYAALDSGMGVRGTAVTTLASAGTDGDSMGERDKSAVLGESERGGETNGGGPSPSAGLTPPLVDGASDLPLVLAILALVAALVMWIVARRRRAAGDYPYQSS